MIIAKTPYRLSLFGGGSDYPAYFEKHGGAVLNTTIDKFCYISARWLPPFFDHKSRVVWSRIENVQSVNDIQHPAVRECLKYMGISDVVINHDGDLPAASGMGTSSSFTVGLLNALHNLKGEHPDKVMLGREAIYVEQQLIKNTVGNQDQLAAAIGGMNVFKFYETEKTPPIPGKQGFKYHKVVITPENKESLESRLILVFTGFPHEASRIADTYKFDDGVVKELYYMVFEAEEYLKNGYIEGIGKLLHKGWELKKRLSESISTDYIDFLYGKAKGAGATGGKLLGAGGGGFLLLYVEPEKKATVKEALKGKLVVPFKFEDKGTQIIGNGVSHVS